MPRQVIVAPISALALDAAIDRYSQLYQKLPRSSDEHTGYRQYIVAEYRFIYTLHPDTGATATAGDVLIVAILPPGEP